jgi:hypothetical protein
MPLLKRFDFNNIVIIIQENTGYFHIKIKNKILWIIVDNVDNLVDKSYFR